ncbi:YwdI family protein [Oceanobacillus manasiensis]|uniref:YwdI family protein n=1 Tax=Oceanobacillus manasiensis TaxID=586413 RepID=UPI0005AB8B76|nr:YwdI family protein [Oceanobacillus manasiensis]
MAVANETIIQKMMKELQQAKTSKHDDRIVQQHVRNVQLLCDLFLEDEKSSQSEATTDVDGISTEELKAMMGKEVIETQPKKVMNQHSVLKEEDANGDSIFDF